MDFTPDELDTAHRAHKDRLRLTKYMDSDGGLLSTYALMDLPPSAMTDDQMRAAHTIREQIAHACRSATGIAVPDEMCKIINRFPSYPETRIDPGDTVVPFGWAHFARPIADPAHPGTVPLTAMLWWTARTDTIPGLASDSEHVLVLIPMGATMDMPGVDLGQLSHLPRVMPMASLIWKLGTDDGSIDPGAPESAYGRSYVRALCTLWALIRQRMVDVDPVRRVMPREYDHYARKTGKPMSEELRIARFATAARTKYDYYGANRPERDHQWWTRMHWRRQWRPSLGRHKPVLIMPHLKGPWDKPIRGQERMLLPPKPLEE